MVSQTGLDRRICRPHVNPNNRNDRHANRRVHPIDEQHDHYFNHSLKHLRELKR